MRGINILQTKWNIAKIDVSCVLVRTHTHTHMTMITVQNRWCVCVCMNLSLFFFMRRTYKSGQINMPDVVCCFPYELYRVLVLRALIWKYPHRKRRKKEREIRWNNFVWIFWQLLRIKRNCEFTQSFPPKTNFIFKCEKIHSLFCVFTLTYTGIVANSNGFEDKQRNLKSCLKYTLFTHSTREGVGGNLKKMI